MDLIENSSDLEMGRRPELKSDEFLIRSILCNEIMSILVEIARRLCHHLLGFEVACGATCSLGASRRERASAFFKGRSRATLKIHSEIHSRGVHVFFSGFVGL